MRQSSTPAQFVGIDINDELVNHYSAAGVIVLRGDLFSLVARPELSRVGVLNLDGYYAVNSPKLHADLRLIRLLAMGSIKLYGEFCLLLNSDLDAAVRQREPSVCGHARARGAGRGDFRWLWP